MPTPVSQALSVLSSARPLGSRKLTVLDFVFCTSLDDLDVNFVLLCSSAVPRSVARLRLFLQCSPFRLGAQVQPSSGAVGVGAPALSRPEDRAKLTRGAAASQQCRSVVLERAAGLKSFDTNGAFRCCNFAQQAARVLCPPVLLRESSDQAALQNVIPQDT